jgi:hypothetical protein
LQDGHNYCTTADMGTNRLPMHAKVKKQAMNGYIA